MAIKAEGIWGCTVLSALAGKDNNGATVVQINVQIDEGPSKGMRGTYEEVVDNRSQPYVERSCTAIGWNPPKWSTLSGDAAKWIAATGGKSTVEVKHIPVKRGKQYDKWVADGMKGEPPVWDKIKGIGRGAARALQPLTDEDEGGAPPADDKPADDQIPFVTCSMAYAIGKVLP